MRWAFSRKILASMAASFPFAALTAWCSAQFLSRLCRERLRRVPCLAKMRMDIDQGGGCSLRHRDRRGSGCKSCGWIPGTAMKRASRNCHPSSLWLRSPQGALRCCTSYCNHRATDFSWSARIRHSLLGHADSWWPWRCLWCSFRWEPSAIA